MFYAMFSFVSSSCFSPKGSFFQHFTDTGKCILMLNRGEMGGVYHTVMSLVDSVVSLIDSWNCRKKDDCCPHCSCLVCRKPPIPVNAHRADLWCTFSLTILVNRSRATFLKVFLLFLVISEADDEEK